MTADRRTHCDFTLRRNAWEELVLTHADGRQLVGVEVTRAFPISAPGEYVSIVDAEGHEVACVEDPSSLPPAVLEVIEEELARREFMPTVLQIKTVVSGTGPSEWHVVTDRGPITLLMEDTDNDVRRLGPSRILLVDTHGVRYLVPDTKRLDGPSRRILAQYL